MPSKPNIFTMIDVGDAKLCNCRCCHRELLGESHREDIAAAQLAGRRVTLLPPLVAGRINGAPYCQRCLATSQPPPKAEALVPRQAAKLH